MTRRNMVRALLSACGVVYGQRVTSQTQAQQMRQSTGVRLVIQDPIAFVVEGKVFQYTPAQIRAILESNS